MADQLDGSIKLGVELSAEDVRKSAQSLQKEISKIFSNSAGKDTSVKFQKLESVMDKLVSKSKLAQDKIKGATDELENLSEKIKSLSYERSMAQLDLKDMAVGSSEYAQQLEIISQYTTEINRLQEEYDTTAASIDSVKNNLASLNNDMRVAIAQSNALQIAEGDVTEYLEDEVDVLNETQSIWKRIGSVASNTLQSIISLLARAGVATLELARNGITKLIGKFKELTHHSNNFGISFKTILRYAFGIRSLFVLFNKVRNAIKDGVNTLAASNGGYNATNAAIRSLTDSLNYLKGALGAAFAPIVQFIAPILTKFIDLLATAANMVGAFFAVLTGKGTLVKATKQTSGLGTASGKAGKAMKDETDQAKKLKSVLAGFDDLDVLNIDDNPMEDLADTLGGGGGAGSGVEFEEINVDQMLPEGLLDWIDRLKEAWANEDWHEVGMIIAEGLNTCFQVVDDWINNTLRPWGVKWAGIIAEILNGVVDGLNWELLGKTIADGLMAAFDIANTFLSTFDFLELGKGIGRALNSAFYHIDGKLIGETFANKWNAIIHTIEGIVTTPGLWSNIGYRISNIINSFFENLDLKGAANAFGASIRGLVKTINTSIENINWSEIAHKISDGFVEALGNLVIALGELDWQSIGNAIGEFIGGIDWGRVATLTIGGLMILASGLLETLLSALSAVFGENGLAGYFESIGADSIAGFFLGISNALADVATWIQENIIDPIVNTVKELLGIHSPSTVFEEIGINIIEGLYNGIVSMIDSIVQRFQQLRDDLINVLEDFKLRAKTKWEEIKTTIHTVVDALKQGAIEKFNDLKAKVIEIKENLKTKLNTIWTTIKNNIETWVNTIKTNAETKFTEMKNALETTMNTAKEKVITAWGNMWSGIKGKINTIIGGVEKFANAVIDAINKVIEALNALGSIDIAPNAFMPDGLHIGLSIPTLSHISIPRLAQGAVIPPNSEFLAMLGDQQRGVNIEAPLDTIVEAFRDVVANMQVENTGASEMVLDGEVFARLITPYVISELERSGYNVEVLEGNV